jgi:hypothetical protein
MVESNDIVLEDEKDAVKLWEKLGVSNATLTFNCGGDSMGDTDWELFDKYGGVVSSDELVNYFNTVVYDEVDFYVNSDGHYIGEFGTVEVELTDEGEDSTFMYAKCASSEWEESIHNDIEIELTENEANYIKSFVSDINGGEDEDVNFNYKKDFIKTDEMVEIEGSIAEKVNKDTSEYQPEDCYDLRDMYQFESKCDFNDNSLIVEITNYDYVIKDE